MISEIQPLPKEKWQGYKIPMQYETSHFYDAEITTSTDGFSASFVKKPLDKHLHKSLGDFPDRLYEEWWDGAEAYGIVSEDGLLATIEIWHEKWSNRLRVTELWVDASLQHKGVGTRLMNLAKLRAQELGCRALMLETQSCNENAIAFYLAQGFTFFGFDRSCYGNNDVERREVRIELGLYLPQVSESNKAVSSGDPVEPSFWTAVDRLISKSEVVIDRPKGTKHPRFNFIYPLDYGYLKNTASMDGGGIDVWRGSSTDIRCDAIICTVDLMKRDSEIKLLIGCTEDEKQTALRSHNDSEYLKGIIIRREMS